MDAYQYPEWGEFVRAIRANPDDVALKLVAADWLEEHDDGDRAALVREMLAPPPDTKELKGLSFKQVRRWFTFGDREPNLANTTGNTVRFYAPGTDAETPRFGPRDAVVSVSGGFTHRATAGVCFVLDTFDDALRVHPVSHVTIPGIAAWETKWKDGHPIVRHVRFHRDAQNRLPALRRYIVGGREVLVSELLLTGRQKELYPGQDSDTFGERTVAELAFEVRFPGVKFEIFI